MRPVNITGSIVGIVLTLMAIYSLKPSSTLAFIIFASWSASPFILTLVLSFVHKNIFGVGVSIYLSVLIDFLLFMDIRYWHPDPQGGIAFVILPFILFLVIIGSVFLIKIKKT